MVIFIALLPILSIFILLFIFRQSSLRAGILAYTATLLTIFFYPSYQLALEGIILATLRGGLISFIAAYVLFFGILLFHLINSAGGIQVIASFISRGTNDHMLQVLILVVGFSPLIESTSGFGVGFMMVTPIFLALGFQPLKAALLGLISLLAIPWGALATGTVIGSELGDISLQQLGIGTALLSIPVFIYFIVVAIYIAGGIDAVQSKWKEILLFSSIFSISIVLFNNFVGVELAGVLSSMLATSLGFLMIKIRSSVVKDSKIAKSQSSGTTEYHGKISIWKVMSPYMILTIFILVSRLVPQVQHFLQSYVVLDLPSLSFSMALLYSPGFWLLVTCICTIYIFKIPLKEILRAFKTTLKQWFPVTFATLAFISISELMAAAGMTSILAYSVGTLLGSSFVLISPFIGGLGGFLTGSNTGANAMFIKLQIQTAGQIGLSPEFIAYAQNASSSHATMANPSRVMLAASICHIQEQESSLLKQISLIVLGAIVLLSVTTLFFGFIIRFE